YSKFVGRSGLGVGRALIVGVTFMSRFGPGKPSGTQARRCLASRQKCRSYNRSVGRSGLSVERALIVGVTFLSRFGPIGPLLAGIATKMSLLQNAQPSTFISF